MKKFGSVNELLDFAMAKEEEAAQFYTDLAKKVERPGMKEVFTELARMEGGHKRKLQAVKDGKLLLPVEGKVLDLKLSDYLVEVSPSADMSYQEALTLAMKREKASFRLYTDLANLAQDRGVKDTLLALAQEEARHKLILEVEYDKAILSDN